MAARNAITAFVLLFAVSAVAQDLPQAPKPKRFLNRRNVALLSLSAGSLVSDALVTQKIVAYRSLTGRDETNPLLRPFAQSRTGTAIYFGTAFAAEAGGMYVAHKTGWKKAEWIIPTVVTVAEAWYSAANYYRLNNSPQACWVHNPIVAIPDPCHRVVN